MAISKISVNTAKLKSTASNLQNLANEIKSITGKMTTAVNQLDWKAPSGENYKKKYSELQDDINRMVKMINEHTDDLKKMAQLYESAESKNVSASSALKTEIIS